MSALPETAAVFAGELFIFPLPPRSKIPYAGSHGLLDATRDPVQIRKWWDDHPDSNIGVNCGLSGLTVIDIDPRNGGDLFSLDLPPAPTVLTPGGGWHVYFAGVTASYDYSEGVEIKSRGRFVLFPPSTHPKGGRYEWDEESRNLPLPPLPERFLRRPQTERRAVATLIPQGERNGTLYRIGRALHRNLCAGDVIEAALAGVNSSICKPPVSDRELSRIAKSAATCDEECRHGGRA
jgi:hypothetical protein